MVKVIEKEIEILHWRSREIITQVFTGTNFLNWKLSLKVNTRDEDILESNEFYHLSRVSGAEKETGKEILKFGKFLSDHQASWWSAVQLCNWDVHQL